MSTLAPPSDGPRRHSDRSSRHYYNSTSSSQSISNKSFNLEDGGGQASPLPPPLPQRPLRSIGASTRIRNHAPCARTQHPQTPAINRDSSYCWSDGSGSTRLPVFPGEENDSFRSSQPALDTIRLQQYNRCRQPTVHKVRSCRKQQQRTGGAMYQRRPATVATAVVYPITSGLVAAAPNSVQLASPSSLRGSPRGHAPAADSASGVYVVRGCGGRCETCENVCYYLLQVSFAMGILIGTSLCIAGAALRRSPGRQLQVLLYIGALVALVCALLLIVQCRARRQASRSSAYQPHSRVDTPHHLQLRQPMPTTTTHLQYGAPVTLLQLQYTQRRSSGVDSRDRDTRILL